MLFGVRILISVGTPFEDDRSEDQGIPDLVFNYPGSRSREEQHECPNDVQDAYYFSDTPNIDNEKFIDSAIQALKSLKPLYEFLTEEI